MITIGANIKLISDDKGSLSSIEGDLPKSSNSSDINSVLNEKYEININPFEDVDYFIGAYTSNLDGDFEDRTGELYSYTFTLIGTDIETFTIAFDTLHNQHPKSIIIDGVEYSVNRAIFTVSGLTKANSHTVSISNWNAEDYNLIITGIYTEITINVDYANMTSIEYSHFDRADIAMPSYGIISNTGSVSLIDYDGEIKDYAEQLLLVEGLETEIYVYNTTTGNKETFAITYTDEWTYNSSNKQVSVSLKDNLEEWQNITIEPLIFDARKGNNNTKTFEWFYRYLWELTPSKYNMLSFDELNYYTRLNLQWSIINYPLLNISTLWEAWAKLCQVCQLHIYKTNNGRTVCDRSI